MTKDGFFKKYEYVYDEYYDCYICPNNKTLTYRTTNKDLITYVEPAEGEPHSPYSEKSPK